MTTRATTASGAICFLLYAAAALPGQDLPRATGEYGAFAFSNFGGTHLLAASALPQAESVHQAFCTDGSRVPVRFDRQQIERANNGRQTPHNFDKLPGNVYAVLRGRIGRGQAPVFMTCFIANASLLESATVLAVRPLAEPTECAKDVRTRLAAARRRPVVRCWRIARLPGVPSLVLAEFARQGTDALASIVLLDRDRTIFADYPAKFEKEGADLWRVDDGGVMTPEGFQVVFLLQRGSSYVLGLSWAGTEGESLAVKVSNDANQFLDVIHDYWYQAPV
jgi:hypothetical protein